MGIQGILTENDLPSITFHVGMSLSPVFEYTGKWFSIILGMFFILGLLKACLGTCFRARRAYLLEGWSWKILTSVWSTWFNLVLLPWHLMNHYLDPERVDDRVDLPRPEGQKEIEEDLYHEERVDEAETRLYPGFPYPPL
jgi:hypothetical protein